MTYLTTAERRLLAKFEANPGQILTPEQLFESLRSTQSVGTVRVHLSSLRRKIGRSRIVTVRGLGYRYDPAPNIGLRQD